MADNPALIESAIREINSEDDGAFVTFAVAANDDLWVQYLRATINAHYPFSVDPKQNLRTFTFSRVEEWVPGEYVWLEVALSERDMALWIDRYFREVLGCEADYRLIASRDE